jgi:hypothetical protein
MWFPFPRQRSGLRMWNVMADSVNDRSMAIVSNLEDRDQARRVEQEIERLLDIVP